MATASPAGPAATASGAATAAGYRGRFTPSRHNPGPRVAVAGWVVCAETDAEAEYLASSQQQAFVALRTGTPGPLPPPVQGYRKSLGMQGAAMLDHVLQCSAVGSAATVARGIAAFVGRTGADEVLIASAMFDHEARKRSLAITAEVMCEVRAAA